MVVGGCGGRGGGTETQAAGRKHAFNVTLMHSSYFTKSTHNI